MKIPIIPINIFFKILLILIPLYIRNLLKIWHKEYTKFTMNYLINKSKKKYGQKFIY